MSRFIEVLVIGYVLLGMLTGIPGAGHVAIGISLLAQILSAILIVTKNGLIARRPFLLWCANLLVISALSIYMLVVGESSDAVFNRALSLLSIFGLIIVLAVPKLELTSIIKKIIVLFALVGTAVIIDGLLFLLVGVAIWPPDIYLGNRFSGPFFDPNFMAVAYGIMLILVLFGAYTANALKKYFAAIFSILVLLALSWSVIAILIVSIILGLIYRNSNYGVKQLGIVALYLVALPVIITSMPVLYSQFGAIAPNIGIEARDAEAKIKSLEYRIVTQSDAIDGILSKPTGQGPRSLVSDLGRDTHNSYLGFGYELGVFGLILLALNVTYVKGSKRQVIDILTSFVFIMALTLNIHYTSLFALLLLIMFDSRTSDKAVVT